MTMRVGGKRKDVLLELMVPLSTQESLILNAVGRHALFSLSTQTGTGHAGLSKVNSHLCNSLWPFTVGFSVQNRIKSKVRSSIHASTSGDLVRICTDASVKHWITTMKKKLQHFYTGWPEDSNIVMVEDSYPWLMTCILLTLNNTKRTAECGTVHSSISWETKHRQCKKELRRNH